jgi:hypothetical protein
MKTIQFKLTFILILTVGLFTTSCVNDDDFETPDLNVTEPHIDGEIVTISSILGTISQNEGETTIIEENIYVEGYVISSDEAGNFFEEIIIQDKPENPTAGIRISVNVNPLFSRFNFGRKVFVKMQGLAVGISNGVGVIGTSATDGLGQIQESQLNDVILRSPEVATIVPVEKNIGELSDSDINTYIRLSGVQFSATSLGKTFAAEPTDEFDGERLLEDCEDGNTLIFNTSTFADFRTTMVPEGSGSIDGLLTLNFFGDTNIFVINEPGDFEFSDSRCNIEVPLEPNITIAELVEIANSGNITEFPSGQNLVTEGYVVSSDISGNFFKNIYIQDLPVNPTAAIQVLVDENDLFQTFSPGNRVLIKLDRLALGNEFIGGVTLGFLGSFQGDLEIERIEEGRIGEFLFATGETADIVPTPVMISGSGIVLEELDGGGNPIPAPNGTLVQLSNVQMPLSDVGSAYTFYSGTESVNRTIESCETGTSTIMRNSGFADFANDPFPTGQGSITAVLGSFGSTDQLLIRTTNDVDLAGERCDPEVLECEGPSGGSNVIFSEDFEVANISVLEAAGWTNVNVTGGNLDYEIGSFSGDSYAQISGFNSGETESEAWLVSPEIDLSGSIEEDLSLNIQTNFDNGNILTIFITDNYTGDPSTTEWTQLGLNVPSGPGSGFGDFESVGPTNISCAGNNVRIGFRYISSDPGPTTRYHIDDVVITGN